MAFAITEPCVGTLDTSCAEVCPVDCTHPGPSGDGFARTTILYERGLEAAGAMPHRHLAATRGA